MPAALFTAPLSVEDTRATVSAAVVPFAGIALAFWYGASQL
jgi:hypothetical protein